MKVSTNLKNWSTRAKNGIAAALFFVAYASSAAVPFMVAPSAHAQAYDTGWKIPTVAQSPAGWTNSAATTVQADDNNYTTNNTGATQGYGSFNFGIPNGAQINGIAVSTNAKSTDSSGCRLSVRLSWDGGVSTTSSQNANLTGAETNYILGDATDTWGRTWTPAELNNPAFLSLLQDNDPGGGCTNDATTSVDTLSVRVYYNLPVQPVANPALAQACGLDIAIVIDNSTSISESEMAQMKNALTSFTNALAGTPTEFSVTRFASSATVLQSFTNNIATVNSAINNVPTGGGYTNWEDGLLKAGSTLPNRSNPNLVIFATDGDPTTSNTVGGTDTSQPNAHLEPAVVAANTIKNGGTRILALGIGLGGDAGSVSRLKQISGPSADTGSVLTSDVITTSFDTLAQALATFATQTCGGTITTQKLIDADGNPQTTNDQTPAAGWTFDINGGSNPAPTVTDNKGLTPAVKVDAGSGYSVNETAQSGYSIIAASCNGAASNGTWNGSAVSGMQIAANNVVRCTFVNTLKKGHLTVHKVTNPANDSTVFSVTASGSGAITGQATRNLSTGSDVTYEVTYGTYSVSEALTGGWSQTNTTCENVTVNDNNPNPTCTITNTKLAKLKIVKDAVPNDPQDFAFTTTGTGLSGFSLDDDSDATLASSKEFVELAPGTYTVTEASVGGWSLTGLSCDTNNFTANGAQVSVQLAAGQVTTCTYTNTKFGSISGTKYEVNADGSTVAVEPSGWIITLFNGDVSTGLTQTTDANGYYTFTGLLPGAYSVSESSLNGWTQVYNPLSPINLLAGQEAENNNFGNFKNGSISGYKFNDLNGQGGRDEGEPGISGWSVTLTGTTKAVNGQPSVAIGPIVNTTNTAGYYEFTNLAPGTYTVCEEQRVNWVQTYPGLNVCQTIVIDISGELNPDSNFGNRAQGTIEVKKVLSPATDPGKFNLAVDGETQASNVGDGGTTGQVTVWAGDHTASEAAGTATDLANYSSTYSCSNGQTGTGVSISDITVSAGDHIVCTFTNTRNTGTITVIKQVVNDNGGTATASDFNLYVNGDTVTSNVANTYNTAVSYAVSEDTKAGYTQTSLICTLAGLPIAVPFTLQTGQNIICTITNDDIGPKLIVKKVVDNGITNLTKESSDFTMNVDATNVSDSSFAGSSSGTTVALDAGSYSVTEGSHSGYAMTASADCTGTVEIGEVKTCTITNTAIEDPGISVVKTGPAFAHEGDTVTYTFTVKNTGNVAFPSGSVIDDVAGDDAVLQTDDDNGVLDQGETWVFTIDYVIPANTTSIHNTVTACGQYGSDELMQEICDEDDHTLTVLHPGIKVVKSGPANAQIGTIGTYTFTVTNTGDTPLTMDSVVDNLAGNGIYVSGDVNDNDRLDLNESWVFQAKLLYGQNGNIVNTVKACAVDVLKGEVCSSDSHTTIVYTPQVLAEVTPPTLEDTGNSIWIAIILSTSIMTLAVATTLQRRRYDSANK